MKEHSLITKKVVWDYPKTPCKSLLFIPAKMRATWKAALPALLLPVQRHKGTEDREVAALPEIPQTLGPETEASDSALVSLWLPVRPALCLLNGGSGKARGERRKLGRSKRFPSQSINYEEKLRAEGEVLQPPDFRKAKRNAVVLKISEQGRKGGKKLPKKKKKKLVYNKDYIL